MRIAPTPQSGQRTAEHALDLRGPIAAILKVDDLGRRAFRFGEIEIAGNRRYDRKPLGRCVLPDLIVRRTPGKGPQDGQPTSAKDSRQRGVSTGFAIPPNLRSVGIDGGKIGVFQVRVITQDFILGHPGGKP